MPAAAPVAQSAFWCLIGLSAFVTPWVWRRVLALDRWRLQPPRSCSAVNAIGAALPLFGHSTALLTASALVFGVSFFAMVGSTTAFVRFNYPPAAMADRHRRIDHRIRHRPDTGPDPHRRNHRCARQPVIRAERGRCDAGIGRGGDGVSEEAGLIVLDVRDWPSPFIANGSKRTKKSEPRLNSRLASLAMTGAALSSR